MLRRRPSEQRLAVAASWGLLTCKHRMPLHCAAKNWQPTVLRHCKSAAIETATKAVPVKPQNDSDPVMTCAFQVFSKGMSRYTHHSSTGASNNSTLQCLLLPQAHLHMQHQATKYQEETQHKCTCLLLCKTTRNAPVKPHTQCNPLLHLSALGGGTQQAPLRVEASLTVRRHIHKP